MVSGYEHIYLGLLPVLKNCDLRQSADRLGLSLLDNGAVAVDFCGRAYTISRDGVEPADGRPVDVNYRSVLAHYVLSRGQGDPANSFVPLARVSGMIEGQKALANELMTGPLLRAFAHDRDNFRIAALQIGGLRQDDAADGGERWDFRVLPKILLRVVYYAADDEFPADLQIFLDSSATRFLEYECLAFLTGCFTRALIQAAQTPARAAVHR
jgi:hypothetical protein